METNTQTAAGIIDQPLAGQALGKVKKFVAVFGALAASVLAADVVLSLIGEEPTSFMWGRTGGVLASAVVLYWLTGLAARGSRAAFIRVRILSVVAPIAIVAIDLIPGTLPAWFITLQIAGAIVLAPTAFIVNRPDLRAAFAKSH